MKVAITGASGLLGPALIRSLRDDGHDVLRLVRRVPAAPDEVAWNPAAGEVDVAALTGVDAVIHLAGANLGGRPWTPAYRRTVMDSRVSGTRTIASALARMEPRPRVLLSASGVGYYGNPGEESWTSRHRRATATSRRSLGGGRSQPMRRPRPACGS